MRKVPTYLQMESTECGAVSLGMVMASWGLHVSPEELRDVCGVSRDGSNAVGILRAARRYGFEARGLKEPDLDRLADYGVPLILFWEFNHFVVFVGRRGEKFVVNDPGVGERLLTREEMDGSYTGVILEIRPGEGFRRTGRRRGSLGLFLGQFASVWREAAFIVCLGFLRLDLSRLNIDASNGVHEVTLTARDKYGVTTSNFTCTCFWAEPPPPPQGSEENPWTIGDDVQAYTNGAGGLIITGAGATSNFTDAVSLPWSLVADSIDEVTIPEEVTVIGGNLWAGLGEVVVINGETIVRRKGIAAGFPDEDPSGAVSPAEFERIEIVDGKALLGIAVWTNSEVKVTGEGWGVATNDVIEVPAPGRQGFFILKSKPGDSRLPSP